MSLKYISSAWKTDFKTGFPRDMRFYIDFRQQSYPPIPVSAGGQSDGTYTLITSAENRSGSHDLTGGMNQYALPLPSAFTIRCSFRPEFAYNVASDQILWSWWIDADHYLELYYDTSEAKFRLGWEDGGTFVYLESAQFDDGTSHRDIDQDMTIDCALDLSSTSTSGSALYWNRTQDDTTWSATKNAKASNFATFGIRGRSDGSATDGSYSVNHLMIIDGLTASSSQVSANYKDVKNEQIFWHLNGEGVGRTRCNVTSRVDQFELEKSVIDSSGRRGANVASFSLMSPTGQFADDQFATFDASNEKYNGSSSQAFMTKQTPAQVESWYDNKYELLITGRIGSEKFARQSGVGRVSRVQIGLFDTTDIIQRKVIKNAVKFEDYKMSDSSSESASLVHVLARLATAEPVTNYLSNSSFENATIGNSWLEDGLTLSRQSGGLFGSYCGQANTSVAWKNVYQTVIFTYSAPYYGTKELNKNETYTFGVWLKSTSACSGLVLLNENDASGHNDDSYDSWSLSGGEGWKFFSTTHKLTDAQSDRLIPQVRVQTTGVNVQLDGAMLTQNRQSTNWFVLNDNDGSSGISNGSLADSADYDTCGFDVDSVNIVHPWVFLPQFTNPWTHLGWLADATLAIYIGFDSAGTFVYKSRLATGYSDQASLETVSATRDVSSFIEQDSANSIIIAGIRITKDDYVQEVWNAGASGDFTVDDGGVVKELLANGYFFPSYDDFGEYWAKYGDGTDNPEAFGKLIPTTSGGSGDSKNTGVTNTK
jgi:hypothetical protein